MWIITAFYFFVLLGYSILLPTYRAPDEPLHVDLAHLFAEDATYPEWDDAATSAEVQASLDYVQWKTGSAHLSKAAALPKAERPSFEDLADSPNPPGINHLAQHPPLYYIIAGTAERAVTTVTGDLSFDAETWFYRFVSIVMVTPLPLIIWRIGTLLKLPSPVGIAATLMPLAIPQFTHIGASVSNDTLLMLLFWTMTLFMLRFANGDLRQRTLLIAGVVTGLALLTKAFALTLGVLGLLGLLLAWRRRLASRREVIRSALIYGGPAMVIGGWWWVRNLILFGDISPSRYNEIYPDVDNVDFDAWYFVREWAYQTTRRFWGEFAYFDVPLPAKLVTVATLICLAAIALACLKRDRVAQTQRGTRLLLIAPLGILMVAQFLFALQEHLRIGQLPGLQGRYWFGAIAGLATIIVLGMAQLIQARLHWLPLMVFAGVIVMQSTALVRLLDHYWAGDNLADQWEALVAWAPLPGELIYLGAAAGAVVAGLTVGQLILLARS